MNRKLDGNPLETSDLIDIAISAGLATADKLHHKQGEISHDAKFHSFLIELTKETRFSMFSRGELNLDTRNSLNTLD